MVKRFICDIDYTLLIPNYYRQKDFFLNSYPDIGDYVINNYYSILKNYEVKYKKYDINILLEYLNSYSKVKLDIDFMYNWINYTIDLDDQDVTESKQLLSYIKELGIEIVALSNWFKFAQLKKLERLNLDTYFDYIYAGDDYLKPHKEAYELAMGANNPDNCIILGDNLDQDVIVPSKLGIAGIHYTRGEDVEHEYLKVKKLIDAKKIIKERFYGVK